jgi:hypothetical protein
LTIRIMRTLFQDSVRDGCAEMTILRRYKMLLGEAILEHFFCFLPNVLFFKIFTTV